MMRNMSKRLAALPIHGESNTRLRRNQSTPINPNNSRILHANRQHPQLQARRTQNPLHQEPIRRNRTPDHDLHTTTQINKRQKKRQAHQKSTKFVF
jgi:hypothetical protein